MGNAENVRPGAVSLYPENLTTCRNEAITALGAVHSFILGNSDHCSEFSVASAIDRLRVHVMNTAATVI